MLDEGIGSDSKVSMMVALMDSLYAALGLFIKDGDKLPQVVHKKVRLVTGAEEWERGVRERKERERQVKLGKKREKKLWRKEDLKLCEVKEREYTRKRLWRKERYWSKEGDGKKGLDSV